MRKRPASAGGSSPLTRGKRVWERASESAGRLIPAHAGKTVTRCHARCHARAHPRSRGENTFPMFSVIFHIGSSPLTRGKRPHIRRFVGEERLIPAHAGKTSGLTRPPKPASAHPRSRGENALTEYAVDDDVGSSPLTRGKHYGCADRRAHARLIPAHAGKTGRAASSMPG